MTAIRFIFLLTALTVALPSLSAQEIVRKKDAPQHKETLEKVIVDGDTVSRILPERNFGRFDRGLFNYIFIPKGKWGFGISASYGELDTEDIRVLDIAKDFNFKGKLYSVRPYIQYFFRSNQAIGLKFDYTRGYADLASLSVDFDDDINFNIRDASYYQQTFQVSTFYRDYVGLDHNGRFGIFNEVDLAFGSGSSRFKRLYDNKLRDTRTNITKASLNFSPGLCVFVQDYVSLNVSFGVFGIHYRHEHQKTNGIDEGTRDTSGANFRFNLFNINFGLMVVI